MRKTAKIVLTGLALLPLLFVFLHPGTNPGASTLQQKVEISRLPVMALAAALLAVLPGLVALLHWQHADFDADASGKHPLLERNCVLLC